MSFNKNPKIKKANTEVEITPDQIIELEKCINDPIYFIRTYVKIQHPKLGTLPFTLYPYQENIINCFKNNRYNIILSPRQTGKCCHYNTKIDIITKPKGFKKYLLWLFNNNLYKNLYKNK